MSIGRDCNLYSGFFGEPGIIGREIEAVRARVYLEKAAIALRVENDSFNIYFVAGSLQQKSARRMPQNMEVPVVHCPQDTLRLLRFSQRKTRMNRADRVVEFAQRIIGIIERAVCENIDFGGFQNSNTIQPTV